MTDWLKRKRREFERLISEEYDSHPIVMTSFALLIGFGFTLLYPVEMIINVFKMLKIMLQCVIRFPKTLVKCIKERKKMHTETV